MAKALQNPKGLPVLLKIRMERDVTRTLPGGGQSVLRAGEQYTIDEDSGLPFTESTKDTVPVMKTDGTQETENGRPVFQEVIVAPAATIVAHKLLEPTTPKPKEKKATANVAPVIRPAKPTAVPAASD